jgi:hypothetical protein
VVLDWHNGPREGLFASESGTEWHFAAIGESPDPAGHRMYALRRLRDGSVARVIAHLGKGEPVPVPVWIPEWGAAEARHRRAARRDPGRPRGTAAGRAVRQRHDAAEGVAPA